VHAARRGRIDDLSAALPFSVLWRTNRLAMKSSIRFMNDRPARLEFQLRFLFNVDSGSNGLPMTIDLPEDLQ
jgi:hypothetical protein